MTEDVLNAAIQKLRAAALEQYALIKDTYHQPMNGDTVNVICNAASSLAQFEGAMVTLQQYAEQLASRTPAEIAANGEEEIEEQAEVEKPEAESRIITEEELIESSPTYRRTRSSKSKDE